MKEKTTVLTNPFIYALMGALLGVLINNLFILSQSEKIIDSLPMIIILSIIIGFIILSIIYKKVSSRNEMIIYSNLFPRENIFNYSVLPNLLDELYSEGSNSVYHQIALKQIEESARILPKVKIGKEYVVEDIVEANMIFMKSLPDNSTFYGVSVLINPITWLHEEDDKRYKEFNIEISEKIHIERVFIFNDDIEFEKMKPILKELAIVSKVWWILKSEIDGLEYNPDISVSNRSTTSLKVSVNAPNSLNVHVSNDPEVVNRLIKQFKRIQKKAKSFK